MEGNVMALSGGKTLTIFLAADLKKFNGGIAQAQGGLKGLAGSMKNLLGPAAIGAGIAVAGLATKMAVDGVKAALDDEEAMNKLALTMENLGLAHDTGKVEDYISVLERSLGIADTELRPAYDRLVRALGDTDKAQDALSLSLDVSAGSGKSLTAVTDALGKAYEGNIAGLSRLGAGIDASVIRSGDMNAITQTLANTFSGQAAESADTLRGRMGVLKTAVDNLGEAFGRGLLTGVESATAGTKEMVQTLQDLEDEAEKAGTLIAVVGVETAKAGGKFLGTYSDILRFTNGLQNSDNAIVQGLARSIPFLSQSAMILGGSLEDAAEAAESTGDAIGFTATEARKAIPQWNNLTGAIRMSTQQFIDFQNANRIGNSIIKEANKDYMDLAARQKVVNTFTYEYTGLTETANTTTGAASTAVEKLTKREKELTKAHGDTSESLTKNRSDLAKYTEELQKATDAIESFTDGMQANLLAGVDLGKAFMSAKESGGDLGAGVVAGFESMINDAKWFGNVLETLQSQGVDQSLIDYLASQGAEIGGGLGQAMLGDKGLLAKLEEQWVNVQATTKTLAEGLVPEFMVAGQTSALTMIDTISETMAKEVTRLAKIGKKIAKPLGQSFKAELMKDVAAALREVEAAGTAGRVEAVARAESRQVALTNAAVAQALQNLVRGADARNGAPIAPVLS
jgi:hypothetical protein